MHKNTVLDADVFDIMVERRRVYAATTASNVVFGHASRLTHRQHLAVPHVSAVLHTQQRIRKTILTRHHLLLA
jgi:hypothetical protein